MIYVLISGNKAHNKTEQTEKRDCRILRQPLSLLPKETREYIENTKSEQTRLERNLAYTSLFCGLKTFFEIENASIKKTKDRKPYLVVDNGETEKSKDAFLGSKKQYQKNEDFASSKITEQKNKTNRFINADCSTLPCTDDFSSLTHNADYANSEMKNIYISISHSDGVSAVCLSDEGEVGIDIQSDVNSSRVERLNERFFPDLTPVHTCFDVRYYFCHINESEAILEPMKLDDADTNFETVRWSYGESLIKLFDGGFSDLKLTTSAGDKTKTELKKYCQDTIFTVAISTLK